MEGDDINFSLKTLGYYCEDYSFSKFKVRSAKACYDWVSRADPSVDHFFFRAEGNYQCAMCPRENYKAVV